METSGFLDFLLVDLVSEFLKKVLVFYLDALGPHQVLAHRVSQGVPFDGPMHTTLPKHQVLFLVGDLRHVQALEVLPVLPETGLPSLL